LELNNYPTSSKARVKANKNTPKAEFEEIRDKTKRHLAKSKSKSAKANLNGVVVELITNSEHQYEFWTANWWPAADQASPDARIYSVTGLDGLDPAAFYYPPEHTSIFVNTEYYGQCKSWALGMAASILEKKLNTLSVHGASALYRGKGVIIVAPTGTGKTTQSFKIFLSDEGKICGDDWVYIAFPNTTSQKRNSHLIARQPERRLYMRSETQKEQQWLRSIFDRSLNENVTTRKKDCEYPEGAEMCKLTKSRCVFNDAMNWCYYAFGNSRSLILREDLLGPEKVVEEVPVDLVVLLRRDTYSPAEIKLSSDAAIDILKKGEYQILPGAGPREMWGTMSYEPWYNPYLLDLDNKKQEHFFRAMFEQWHVPCIILNTGVDGIDETHRRIISALS
jgi:hypothetical protein